MKAIKLLAASVLAFGLANASFAFPVIKITGSTAIRKALYSGIYRKLIADAGAGGQVRVACCDPYFNNKSADGAQQTAFVAFDNTNTIVEAVQTCLSGSVGGIGYVIGGNDVQSSITLVGNPATAWISVTNPTPAQILANFSKVTAVGAAWTYVDGAFTANGGHGNMGFASGAQAYVGVAYTVFDPASTAHVCMSDSYQDSTSFNSTDWGNALDDTLEGTVTFTFAKGQAHPGLPAGSYARLTNLSAQNFRALATNGFISLKQITNNAADANVDVVLVGRNSDSGTRLATFAETGYGPVTQGAKQYVPQDAANNDAGQSGSGNINHFSLLASDQDGYDSGAFVSSTLGKAIDVGAVGPGGAGHTFIQVSYVSAGDAPGAGQWLTYDGQPSMSSANVISGSYTFWTTEHFLYDTTAGFAPAEVAIINGIKSNVITTDSNGAYVNQGALGCHRAGAEGTTVLVP